MEKKEQGKISTSRKIFGIPESALQKISKKFAQDMEDSEDFLNLAKKLGIYQKKDEKMYLAFLFGRAVERNEAEAESRSPEADAMAKMKQLFEKMQSGEFGGDDAGDGKMPEPPKGKDRPNYFG